MSGYFLPGVHENWRNMQVKRTLLEFQDMFEKDPKSLFERAVIETPEFCLYNVVKLLKGKRSQRPLRELLRKARVRRARNEDAYYRRLADGGEECYGFESVDGVEVELTEEEERERDLASDSDDCGNDYDISGNESDSDSDSEEAGDDKEAAESG